MTEKAFKQMMSGLKEAKDEYGRTVFPDCRSKYYAVRDAIELLKEQEPRVMTRLEIEQSKGRIVWFEDDQFNSYALVDGIDQRNSWVWLSTVGNMCLQQRRDCENYGKRWRCWTQKPTQEQMKAVKWDGQGEGYKSSRGRGKAWQTLG